MRNAKAPSRRDLVPRAGDERWSPPLVGASDGDAAADVDGDAVLGAADANPRACEYRLSDGVDEASLTLLDELPSA